MKIGTVTEAVHASKRAVGLTGPALLLVNTPEGDVAAADLVGAAPGDRVLLATGAVAARYAMEVTVDAAVVAVLAP